MSLPSQRERQDTVRKIARTFLNEWNNFEPEFGAYEQGYNWLMGEQYTDNQKAWYRAQRRPTNVWNLIFPVFNRMLGDFLLNQAKDRVYAKRGGNPKMAGIVQDLIDDIAINTNYKDEMAATILA